MTPSTIASGNGPPFSATMATVARSEPSDSSSPTMTIARLAAAAPAYAAVAVAALVMEYTVIVAVGQAA